MPSLPHARGTGVAVVTGSASGIGAAAAAELSARGWRVGGLDLAPSAGCDMSAVVDVTDAAAVAAALDSIRSELGPVDAAVSVAGHYAMVPVSEITLEQWTRMLRVHLGGLRNLSKSALPGMLERGAGCIVTISSELALGGGSGDAHYAAAKGADHRLHPLARHRARVAGRPRQQRRAGPTDTPLLVADSPWRAPDYLETLPLRRLVRPEEVAQTVALLVEEGGYFSATILAERRRGDLMERRFEDKLALVSGAGQGIGHAIARRLAAEGASVAVNDREASPRVDAVVAETGGIAAIADVSDPDAVARMVAEVEATLGRIDVLVANHAYMSMAPFTEARPGRLVAERRREPRRHVLPHPCRRCRRCAAAAVDGS